MAVKTLLDIDLGLLLKKLQQTCNIELPSSVIEASLVRNVLHIRFSYPNKPETNVEPLPLKTPAFLFRDEESGEITAIEIIDIQEALKELK
jgi:hypothetical protein